MSVTVKSSDVSTERFWALDHRLYLQFQLYELKSLKAHKVVQIKEIDHFVTFIALLANFLQNSFWIPSFIENKL